MGTGYGLLAFTNSAHAPRNPFLVAGHPRWPFRRLPRLRDCPQQIEQTQGVPSLIQQRQRAGIESHAEPRLFLVNRSHSGRFAVTSICQDQFLLAEMEATEPVPVALTVCGGQDKLITLQ